MSHWNEKKSIALSKIGVLLFMLLILAAAAADPWLVAWLVDYSQVYLAGKEPLFYLTLYTSCVPALLLLHELYRLLQRISGGAVFTAENVKGLRRISWYALLGSGICLASALYYLLFVLIAFAAAFVGLIVRVVKNVFAQAVELQHEVDYTI